MADSKNALANAFDAIDHLPERIVNPANSVQMELSDRGDLAGFEDLPVDVVCALIPYLKIEDVLACAAASKRCRAIWTEPSVATCLCLHFFPALKPGVVDSTNSGDSPGQSTTSSRFTYSAFCEVSKRYFIRRAGKVVVRIAMSLPFSDNDTLNALLFSPNLRMWDRDARRVLGPDPVLHPRGKFPAGWLGLLGAKFACYGGGNVVWFALPHFLVVDNMYKRLRRVVQVTGGTSPEFTAAASKALVVLCDHSEEKLLIYDIASNTSSHYQLPSGLRSMVIQNSHIFLVLNGMQICILHHDGSRVLTKHRFHCKVDADPYLSSEFFTSKGTVLIFPHPHDPDCFFVAINGWLNREPPSEDDELSEDDSDTEEPTKYLVVMEFAGSLHIATYRDPWSSCPVDDERIFFSAEAEALDDQGTYATGHWTAEATDEMGLTLAGVPPPPDGFRYSFQTSFNTVTRKFGTQRQLVPAMMRAGRCGPPWALQAFFPVVPSLGVLKIRRFDAEDADSYPTRPSRPESNGERADLVRDWTVDSLLIDGVAEETCRFFHDEVFTVMFLEDSHLVYVWSYVKDEGPWAVARPSSPLKELREALVLD